MESAHCRHERNALALLPLSLAPNGHLCSLPDYAHSITVRREIPDARLSQSSLKRMFLTRKFTLPHFLDEILYRGSHRPFDVGIAFDELRGEIVEQTKHVMQY